MKSKKKLRNPVDELEEEIREGRPYCYCAHCFKEIWASDNYYECPECKLLLCSFTCYEEHDCGVVNFPEIEVPWKDDPELKDIDDGF